MASPGVPESLILILVWSWCFTPPSLLPVTPDIFLFCVPLCLQGVFGFDRFLPVLLFSVLEKSWKDKVEAHVELWAERGDYCAVRSKM